MCSPLHYRPDEQAREQLDERPSTEIFTSPFLLGALVDLYFFLGSRACWTVRQVYRSSVTCPAYSTFQGLLGQLTKRTPIARGDQARGVPRGARIGPGATG